jgi:isovaleryl-CoA dehydrogenase
MQAAFDYAVEYVHDREQFGQPVGTFQLMQGEILPLSIVLVSIESFRSQDCGHVHKDECQSLLRLRPRTRL